MAFKSLSTAALRREIERRERSATSVTARRNKLAKKLAKLDAELAYLGVAAPTHRGRKPGRKPTGHKGTRQRPMNKLTLTDAIAAAMEKGAVVSPFEAAGLVKANGYRTMSKTFNISVSQALTKDKRFKRVERGQYKKVAK